MNYKQKWESVQKEIKDIFGSKRQDIRGHHFITAYKSVTEETHPVLYRIITEEKINE